AAVRVPRDGKPEDCVEDREREAGQETHLHVGQRDIAFDRRDEQRENVLIDVCANVRERQDSHRVPGIAGVDRMLDRRRLAHAPKLAGWNGLPASRVYVVQSDEMAPPPRRLTTPAPNHLFRARTRCDTDFSHSPRLRPCYRHPPRGRSGARADQDAWADPIPHAAKAPTP